MMATSLQDEYTTIDRCIAGPDISSDLITCTDCIYPGCKCKERCCNDSDPLCSCNICFKADRCLLDAYIEEGSPPIFECNSKCDCNVSCINRTTQQYDCHPLLETFRTNKKGVGIQAKAVIPKGSYLGEYVGEVLSSAQTRERLRKLKPTDSCYIVQFKEHLSNGNILVTNIDAGNKGNLIRFVNHSCSPNAVIIPVRTNSVLPRLCLFTSSDIIEEEEVCFSYFGRIRTGDRVAIGGKQCFCGSEECLGYLPLME